MASLLILVMIGANAFAESSIFLCFTECDRAEKTGLASNHSDDQGKCISSMIYFMCLYSGMMAIVIT